MQNIGEFSIAVAKLQEELFDHFCVARRRFEKAFSTRKFAALPSIQQNFREATEDLYRVGIDRKDTFIWY